MTEDTSADNDTTKQQADSSKERFERIGAELRQRREALSLDQADVARQLHLPGMVVNDIETGEVGKLSGLYRRGYIRNYARLLGLDPDAVLAEAGEDVMPELQKVLPDARRDWQLERYLKIATYVIVTVAIVPPLVYFFIAGGTRLLERQPESALAVVAAQSADVDERGVSASGPEGDDRAAPADSSQAPHVSASALPLNPIRPVQEPQPQADPGGESSPALAAATTGGSVPPPSQLQLELLEDSWVEIHDAAGARLEYDLLRSGQARRYEGEAPFRLLVGRSSAVKLIVNGRAVTWEGYESGDVAELSVAADGEVQR